jgi:UDP-glucose 4-epimerase
MSQSTCSTVCVTGGAGFIGSHVAEALLRDGHTVLVLDDLSGGRQENVPDGAELVVADIRSSEAATLMREAGVEVLIHHAAQMDVRRSVADPRFDADVNICGLINLVEAGRASCLRQVVLASTGGAMYGDQQAFPATEDHPARPVSPYGISKRAGELYLYYYRHQYGLAASCLRYANVYGPRQNPHGEAGVVAIFIDAILDGRTPTIHGDGGQTRDYVWVHDVVRANLAVLGRDGFEVFNVGTGIETDVNELYRGIRQAAGAGPEAHHGPAKPGEQRRSSISSERLREATGLEVSTPLACGLEETVAWFRARRT